MLDSKSVALYCLTSNSTYQTITILIIPSQIIPKNKKANTYANSHLSLFPKIEHVGQEDTPQQRNGHDCGVFVCTLAYFLSKGKDMEAEINSHNCLIANYMALQRKRIIMSLLNPRYPISLPFVD